MRWVSIGLFTHKNRTTTLEASINITNKTPFEYIPDTDILNAGGLHTVASDIMLKLFTSSSINSRCMSTVSISGTPEIALNKNRLLFMTEKVMHLPHEIISTIENKDACIETKAQTSSS